MRMEHCWNDSDKGKMMYSQKELFQFHVPHQTPQNGLGIESELPWSDTGDQPPSNKRDHYTVHAGRPLKNNLRFY